MSARRWVRKAERACCAMATYSPLVFVYSLTTWGVWVMVKVGSSSIRSMWIGTTSSILAVILYGMLNWCYTVAVMTPPGSTTNNDGYGLLPTHGTPPATSFTVKSNGEIRYCKKCQARKPDRAHHCSTCHRCVLKMDHHCPWLATCLGLRNYKPFLLFLIYTTVFCLYGFLLSACWIWAEILDDNVDEFETLLPINFVMMCVLGGVIGLVIGAFTAWHIMLAFRGQTTLECFEKHRYMSPLRKTIQHAQNTANMLPHAAQQAAQQLVNAHANALPGVTRPEEGEERSDARNGFQPTATSYAELERQRSRKRYEEYLDEQDSAKLPNAFDLGWKNNLLHLFGPSRLLWFLPVCNTTGDGWSWQASPKWLEARDRIRQEREAQRAREVNAGWGEPDDTPVHIVSTTANGAGSFVGNGGRGGGRGGGAPGIKRAPSKADRILGRDPSLYADGPQDVPMQRLSPYGRHNVDDEDDEDDIVYTTEEEDDEQHDDRKYGSAKAAADRHEAERRAMDVVTNGAGFGRGGASGMLRKGSSQSANSSRTPTMTPFQDGRVD